ncbi:membrane protein [Lactococcus phage RH10]|nr:membrane protein [Lactococcus phage RH10]
MKDSVKTLMIVAGVGFAFIVISWLTMLSMLLIAWLGGNI